MRNASSMAEVPPRFFRSLVDHLDDGIYFVDSERRITYWNRGAERLTGYAAEEALGNRCMDNLLCHVDGTGELLCGAGCPLVTALKGTESEPRQVYLRHREGHRVPVNVRTVVIRDDHGGVIGAAEIFTDVSERKAASVRAELLERLVLRDPLTGIANRRGAEQRIEERLAGCRIADRPFGLLLADVDHFKQINDEHGHATGDAVLRAVAETLLAATRTTDLVGRWGGDEFVALLATDQLVRVQAIAERMRALVASMAVPGPHATARATVSIGGTLAHAADTLESCIARADAQAYAAKRAGRNRVAVGA
jgi:diguanylate cyclase (GGDEF)-like protein/PAS domain S-box-containing protein